MATLITYHFIADVLVFMKPITFLMLWLWWSRFLSQQNNITSVESILIAEDDSVVCLWQGQRENCKKTYFCCPPQMDHVGAFDWYSAASMNYSLFSWQWEKELQPSHSQIAKYLRWNSLQIIVFKEKIWVKVISGTILKFWEDHGARSYSCFPLTSFPWRCMWGGMELH